MAQEAATTQVPLVPEVQPATLVRNSTLVMAGKVFGLIAAGILALLTVRLLSVDEYSQYALAMSMVLVAAALAELGTSTTVIREVAVRPQDTPRIVGTAITAQFGAAVVAAVLVVPLGLVLGYTRAVIVLLVLGCVLIVAQALFAATGAVFQGRRLMGPFVLAGALQGMVSLVLGAGALTLGLGPPGLVVAIALGYLVAVASTLVLLQRHLWVRPNVRGAWRRAPGFLRVSVPIAIASGTAVIYGRIDVLLLSKLDSVRAVGTYNVPLTIMEMTMLASGAVSVAFFPLLTQQFKDDRADARRSLDLLWRLYLLGLVPVCLVLAIGGTDIITAVFGEPYRSSGAVLTILAATGVVNSLGSLLWQALVAGHRERARIPAVLVGLAFNVAANAVLIPAHGPRGAAIALLASDVFVVIWLAVVVRREVLQVPFARRLVLPGIALAVSVVPLVAVGWDSGVLPGVTAAAVYVALLVSVRYIAPREWAPLSAPLTVMLGRARSGRGRSSSAPH